MNSDRDNEMIEAAVRNFNVPPAEIPHEEMWSRIRVARDFNRQAGVSPRDDMWESITVARASRAPKFSRAARRAVSVRPVAESGAGGRRGTGGRFHRGFAVVPFALLAASLALIIARLPGDGSSAPGSSGNNLPFQTAESGVAAGWQGVQLPSALGGFAFTGYAGSGSHLLYAGALDDPAFEAFKRAAIVHLKRSEALITGFRTLTSEAAMVRQTRSTGRELLSVTRLLIGSPISARTQYRDVFQDLELVLMKMAVISPTTLEADRAQIETTLERRRLLTRMRVLIPQPSTSNAN